MADGAEVQSTSEISRAIRQEELAEGYNPTGWDWFKMNYSIELFKEKI